MPFDIKTRQSSGYSSGDHNDAYRRLKAQMPGRVEMRVSIEVKSRSGCLQTIERSWVIECWDLPAVEYVRARLRALMEELDCTQLRVESGPESADGPTGR